MGNNCPEGHAPQPPSGLTLWDPFMLCGFHKDGISFLSFSRGIRTRPSHRAQGHTHTTHTHRVGSMSKRPLTLNQLAGILKQAKKNHKAEKQTSQQPAGLS